MDNDPGYQNDVHENEDDFKGGRGELTLSAYDESFFNEVEGGQNKELAKTTRAVEEYFDIEAADHIRTELANIKDIENNSIGNLRMRNELAPEDEKIAREINASGIHPDNLTTQEAKKVLAYAMNATEDIKKHKADRIYDAICRHINSPRSRHDGLDPRFYNPEEARKKAVLGEKYEEWERGELDTSRGFDKEKAYEKAIESGWMPASLMREHIDEEDLDVLCDEGWVDEDIMYVYGPFTNKDLEGIKLYIDSTWTDISSNKYRGTKDSNYGHTLPDFLNTTFGRPNTSDLEEGLLRDYIASEILPSRRLDAKSLIIAATADSLKVLDIKKAEGENYDKALKEMRRSAGCISRYLSILFRYPKQELKERFNISKRGLSKDFLEEIAMAVSDMSEGRAEFIEKNYQPYLAKINEHIYNIERLLDSGGEDFTSMFAQESEEYD